jgi:hypothetical protein
MTTRSAASHRRVRRLDSSRVRVDSLVSHVVSYVARSGRIAVGVLARDGVADLLGGRLLLLGLDGGRDRVEAALDGVAGLLEVGLLRVGLGGGGELEEGLVLLLAARGGRGGGGLGRGCRCGGAGRWQKGSTCAPGTIYEPRPTSGASLRHLPCHRGPGVLCQTC